MADKGTFPFDKLPPELRIQIWSYLIPDLSSTFFITPWNDKCYQFLIWHVGPVCTSSTIRYGTVYRWENLGLPSWKIPACSVNQEARHIITHGISQQREAIFDPQTSTFTFSVQAKDATLIPPITASGIPVETWKFSEDIHPHGAITFKSFCDEPMGHFDILTYYSPPTLLVVINADHLDLEDNGSGRWFRFEFLEAWFQRREDGEDGEDDEVDVDDGSEHVARGDNIHLNPDSQWYFMNGDQGGFEEQYRALRRILAGPRTCYANKIRPVKITGIMDSSLA